MTKALATKKQTPAATQSPSFTGLALRTMSDLEAFCRAAVDSRFFEDVRDVGQAIVKIQAGAELGIQPVASLRAISIIKNKVCITAGGMAGLVKKSGTYTYREVEHTNEVCSLAFFENGNKVGVSTFTMDDAKRAGLLRNKVWQSFPKDMLFARAVSAGTRRYCPDLFVGGTVYVDSEMRDVVELEQQPKQRAGDLGPIPLEKVKQASLNDNYPSEGVEVLQMGPSHNERMRMAADLQQLIEDGMQAVFVDDLKQIYGMGKAMLSTFPDDLRAMAKAAYVVCRGRLTEGDAYSVPDALREAWADVQMLLESDPAGEAAGDEDAMVEEVPF